MPKKSVDEKIEELALSIARGFAAVDRQLGDFRSETRADLAAVIERLDRIEFSLTGHEQRISTLEDKLLQLARRIGMTFGRQE